LKAFLLASAAALALGGCTTVAADTASTAAAASATPAAAPAPAVPDNVLLAEWTGPYEGVPPE
jgi:peptidyl-dipeptidase Dcp